MYRCIDNMYSFQFHFAVLDLLCVWCVTAERKSKIHSFIDKRHIYTKYIHREREIHFLF
jgi:hypothetical protein